MAESQSLFCCTAQGLCQLSLCFWEPLSPRESWGWKMGRQKVPCATLTPLSLLQNLSLIVVGLGAVFSLIFHLGTKEKLHPPGSVSQPQESTPLLQKEPTRSPRSLLVWKDWLLEPSFYQVTADMARQCQPSSPAAARAELPSLSLCRWQCSTWPLGSSSTCPRLTLPCT